MLRLKLWKKYKVGYCFIIISKGEIMIDLSLCIEKYWRAANYHTLVQMYVESNELMKQSLTMGDIRRHASGHWGTSPGINYIYAHLNAFIKRHGYQVQLVVGPGHAAKALLANLHIEGTLHEYYPEIIAPDCNVFEATKITKEIPGMRSEINPFYPGVLYDGGELGYSLPVAYGLALDNPELLAVCIIGDGEAETGTISAAWHCKEYLGSGSGIVLPILHLNGYRMGNRSLLAHKSDRDLISLFHGLGYNPRMIGSERQEMLSAFAWVHEIYQKIKRNKKEAWPMLLFRSPKGWTAPSSDNIKIEGVKSSHKDPLNSVTDDAIRLAYLNNWLTSYKPDELFTSRGEITEDIKKLIPEGDLRIGMSLKRYAQKKLNKPELSDYQVLPGKINKYRNITILQGFLSDVAQLNRDRFLIVSPDELESNQLGALYETTDAGCGLQCFADGQLINTRVMEVLNENICQAWLQAYALSGRNGLMVSYEAFMPIIISMVSQYLKWLYQAAKVPWRTHAPSLTYLLTSLCWSNTYSHQNPEFINALLSNQQPYVKIYMPPDANSLLVCTDYCLTTYNRVNVIVATKQVMPQWLPIEKAQEGLEKGVLSWTWLRPHLQGRPDLIFAAAGDVPVREMMEAFALMKYLLPMVNIRFLTVFELTALGSPAVYPQAMDQDLFDNYFLYEIPVIFSFHGYSTAIQVILGERIDMKRLTLLGYANASYTSTSELNKLIMNCNSRFNIVLESIKQLYLRNCISENAFEQVGKSVAKMMESALADEK